MTAAIRLGRFVTIPAGTEVSYVTARDPVRTGPLPDTIIRAVAAADPLATLDPNIRPIQRVQWSDGFASTAWCDITDITEVA